MEAIKNADEGAGRIFDMLIERGSELPEDVRAHIKELISPGRSKTFAISGTAEIIFARKEELSNDWLRLGAACAAFAGLYEIHDLGIDGRGLKISQALRRRSGEKAASLGLEKWPSAEEDPEPRRAYLSAEVQQKLSEEESRKALEHDAALREEAERRRAEESGANDVVDTLKE